jgi:nucleotide-binding universal stress UspA family protein
VVERGKPADVIIAKAAADKRLLIAMATHGWTGLNRWLLGSVTEKVLRATNNHVFLVRACDSGAVDNGSTLKSVLVPLDGSALAEAVLPAAVEFAKVLDLEMLLFRAYDLPASAYYGREDYLPDYAALKKNIESEAREYLDEQVIALNAQGILKVRPVLAEGPVAAEIIRLTAAHPELLAAMCTHGRSGVKRWVLGSVTEKVLRHSQGPMLVVRGL